MHPIKKPVSKGPVTRIEDLERAFAGMATAVNKSLNNVGKHLESLSQRLDIASEAIEAVIRTVGVEVVQKAIEDAQLTKALKEAENGRRWIADELTKGTLVATEIVTETSLITGNETKDDVAVGGGYAQIEVSKLTPAVRQSLLGQSPGFVMATPSGNSFKLEGIYETNVPLPVPAAPVTEEISHPSVFSVDDDAEQSLAQEG